MRYAYMPPPPPVYPSPYANTQYGTASGDLLEGGALRDKLIGGGGGDVLIGGGEADLLIAGQENNSDEGDVDMLYGGDGDDILRVSNGDLARGGAGSDVVQFYQRGLLGSSLDYDGGEGLDYLYLIGENSLVTISIDDTANQHSASIKLISVEVVRLNTTGIVYGGMNDDTIIGSSNHAALLYGFGGDDYLAPGGASDEAEILDGGEGWDTVDFTQVSNRSVNVDLAKEGSQQVYPGSNGSGPSGDVRLISIENAIGSRGRDTISGTDGDNHLIGGVSGTGFNQTDGNDLIFGRGGNDALEGAEGADTLNGDQGSDTLTGGADVDQLNGGAGNDLLHGDATADFLAGGEGADTLMGTEGSLAYADYRDGFEVILHMGSGQHAMAAQGDVLVNINRFHLSKEGDDFTGSTRNEWVQGHDGDDWLRGGGGNDYLNGGVGRDMLSGDEGNDTIAGGYDDDLRGGVGDDDFELFHDGGALNVNTLIHGWEGIDRIRVGNLQGDISIAMDARFASQANFDASFVEYVELGEGAGTVYGSSLDDTIAGGAGADQLFGHEGNDTFLRIGVNDRVNGGDGTDTVDLSAINGANFSLDNPNFVSLEKVIAGAGADTLTGGVENDHLQGGRGADVLHGGQGNDYLDGALTGVDDGVRDYVYGDDGADTLIGGVNDVLYGGYGADHFVGRTGGDVATSTLVSYANATSGVVVGGKLSDPYSEGSGDTFENIYRIQLSDHDDLIRGGYDHVMRASGGHGNDNINGGQAADVLWGETGNDTIDGGAGSDNILGHSGDDCLEGGDGADQLFLGSGNDVVYGGEGRDEVWETSAQDSGASFDTGRDTMHGGQGDDVLRSINGHDQLYGDDGNDQLMDGSGANLLSGGEGSDRIVLRGGNDTVDGGAGADTIMSDYTGENYGLKLLIGGAGDDRYEDLRGTETLVEEADGGTETLSFATMKAPYALAENFENISAQNVRNAVDITGNSTANWITGSNHTASDTLSGGGGADTIDGFYLGADSLMGGEGDDVYEIRNFDDTVLELAGQGVDKVIVHDNHQLPNRSYTLTDHVENGELGNNGFVRLTGNSLNNTLTSFYGSDTLDGGIGNDTLISNNGADSLVGGAGDDFFDVGFGDQNVLELEGEGFDTVRTDQLKFTLADNVENLISRMTGTYNHEFTGNALNNVIQGDKGSDILRGGAGDDTLIGVDRFRDTMEGAPDTFYGDDGIDTVVLFGARADYRVVSLGQGGYDIVEIAPGAGGHTHKIYNVEKLQFSDGLVDIGVATNRAPTAVADRITVSEDGPSTLMVLANDSDPDGDQVFLNNPPYSSAQGSRLSLGGGGIVYEPAASFQRLRAGQTAEDTFTYTIRDNKGGESTSTVTVVVQGVNDAPTAAADTVNVLEDATTANIASVLLQNDADPDQGDTRTIVSVNTTGTLGTVTFNQATQSLTYSADAAVFDSLEPGQTATDTFTYVMRDGSGAESTATVTMTIRGDGVLELTTGADTRTMGAGADAVQALAGADSIDGGAGADTLEGGEGEDTLTGGAGADSLSGDEGADTIRFGAGDAVRGGAGRDLLVLVRDSGAAGQVKDFALADDRLDISDYVQGSVDPFASGVLRLISRSGGTALVYEDPSLPGAARDLVVLDGVSPSQLTGAHFRAVSADGSPIAVQPHPVEPQVGPIVGTAAADWLEGLDGADTLEGLAGADNLLGGAGNDLLNGGAGNDNLNGEGGNDTATYHDATAGVTVTLESKTAQATGGSGSDKLANIENLEGSAYKDSLSGDLNSNKLSGLAGDDTLRGLAGADTLDGGAGSDVLYGGAGKDRFVFESLSGDQIKDWEAGEVIDLSKLGAHAIQLSAGGGQTRVDVDVDGDGAYDDGHIFVAGVAPTIADFVL